MSDTVSKKKRSEIMKANKPKGNKSTELKLIQLFKQLGLKGWKRNYRIAGSIPDFVFPKNRIAVYADGCFWHGHNCRNVVPKSNFNYWSNKINANKRRDQEIKDRLENKGWKVFRVWECEITKCELPIELLHTKIMKHSV